MAVITPNPQSQMTASEYDACVAKYADHLYRFALKSLRDSDQAKDIVQESFLRLWENRESVFSGKEKSYLFTIAYRLIVDDVRFAKRYGSNENLSMHADEQGRQGYDNLGEVVQRYVDRLPPRQKTLILLRDYEGYSYREIAEMTSLTETQVKVYIFRARVTLRKEIGDIQNLL